MQSFGMQCSLYIMDDGEELGGDLEALKEVDAYNILATVDFGEKKIAILLPIQLRPRLQALTGKVVGICRIDGEYYVRRVGTAGDGAGHENRKSER